MQAFTIMPFTVREYDLARYGGDKNHWNEVYRGLILPAIKAADLICERDDEDLSSRFVTEKILRKIEAADLIICDLSAHNPNVYLELGWAFRADKKVVLIKDDLTDFNFDLNQYYTFPYSHRLQPSSLESSVLELADVLKATLADSTRSYSILHRLSLEAGAILAASAGNFEANILQQLLAARGISPYSF